MSLFMILLVSCESTQDLTLIPASTEKVEPIDTYTVETGEVKRGQGFYQALKSVSIDNKQALGVINSLQDEVEFSKLKVGDKLKATFNSKKELVGFTFSQNLAESHNLSLNKETQKWDYSFKVEDTFWFSSILEGSLRAGSTLQDDLIAQGLSRPVVAEVINILLCKVNFRLNARMGDQYKILLNERKFNGETIETKIIYTSYSGVRAGKSESFFYQDEEKSSTYTAHYTEDGQPLILSGLRYPINRLHIRSGYGQRIHPVTGRRVMHRGVDLRARTGENVHAVASGKVIESSYNEYGGNKVAIKHRDGSVSYYLHLSKRSVNRGDWVKSYQVIGRVGATGRVTGPHLHFGFKKANGHWMNPMNKRMIATPKLAGERFTKLKEQIYHSKALLDSLELSRTARYIVKDLPNKKENSILEFLTLNSEELFYAPDSFDIQMI